MNNDSGERRKVGRPVCNKSGRIEGSGKYFGKCDVRLTAEQDRALSRIAERNGVSRSDVMRRAFLDFVKFNEEGR